MLKRSWGQDKAVTTLVQTSVYIEYFMNSRILLPIWNDRSTLLKAVTWKILNNMGILFEAGIVT